MYKYIHTCIYIHISCPHTYTHTHRYTHAYKMYAKHVWNDGAAATAREAQLNTKKLCPSHCPHYDSAPSRPHPLICTGAEPVHSVYCPCQLPAWPWPPETRSFFCHFGGVFSSCRFWVLDHLCSNLSQSFHLWGITEIWSLNLCVCFTFSSSVFTFLIEVNFSFKFLFAIWSLSPQRFNFYCFLSMVSWQYQKYSTILILVLCLLCVTPLVCSSYSSFAPSSPFFSSWWQNDCELFTHTLVLQCSPSTSSHQP